MAPQKKNGNDLKPERVGRPLTMISLPVSGKQQQPLTSA
jgi:hypothetical protein